MSKEYIERLTLLIRELKLKDELSYTIEVKHFFGGAAFYFNGIICASLSPVGLAFKLPASEVEKLISSGKAKPLIYFPQGNVKKGYVLFDKPEIDNSRKWKKYFINAANNVQS